jgi:fructuronate reductase
MISIRHWQNEKSEFTKQGIELPKFDVTSIRETGKKQPIWIHFGGGNLFRAYHAAIAQNMLDNGDLDRGVVVVETFSPFTIDKIYAPYNNDILQVVMSADGTLKERLLSSVATALFASPKRPKDLDMVKQYFENKVLQLCTFTITEKGYTIHNLESESDAGPNGAKSTIGIVAALLYARYKACAAPIAMVSTDNFSKNGERFRSAVLSIVKNWLIRDLVDRGFFDYISDEKRVSFPWTMIDRITPNPSQETAKFLVEQGFNDLPLIDAGHGATFAGFSNTEKAHYLVVEDNFPNGRPPFELSNVIMCDRETAALADTMKVTACLNPLHTCLAIFGCLLGYKRIWQEMRNNDLVKLIRHIGFDEDLPVVQDPKVIDPSAFMDELLNSRLPNKNLPDAPQRIACDTSQKMSIRYGYTIKSYVNRGMDVSKLVYIPLVIAAWLRYLLGVDDSGDNFDLSPDPLIDDLRKQLKGLSLGESDLEVIHSAVKPILCDSSIFAVDLYKVGLGEKIECYLKEFLAGKGAVSATIKKYI